MVSELSMAPPPPPPPPLPLFASAAAPILASEPIPVAAPAEGLAVEFLEVQEVIDVQDQPSVENASELKKDEAVQKKQLADELSLRLAGLRRATQGGDEEEPEDEWEDDESVTKENAQKMEAEIQRKKQINQAIIDKYKAKFEGRDLGNREIANIKQQINTITTDKTGFDENKRIKKLADDVAQLMEFPQSVPHAHTQLPPVMRSVVSPEALPIIPQISIEEEEVVLPGVFDIDDPLNAGQELAYDRQVKAILADYAVALDFYKRLNDDPVLHNALSIANNLTLASVMDSLIICDYVLAKRREIATKHLPDDVVASYNASLDNFYMQALAIRFSDDEPKQQLKRLKEVANEHFKPHGTGLRMFADALIMVSVLSIAAVAASAAVPILGVSLLLSSASAAGVVGLGTSLAFATSSFFCQKPSTRKRDLEKRLNDTGEDEDRLLKGDLTLGA